mmetsp:Transcript_19487/g.58903  ORF Transcript_19487/g.58903 Transcript_19487/m.58903 type:complete len:291 (-) Transcript_19487:499-1371(-)
MSRKSTDHDDDMTEVDVENGNNGWDNHRSDERNDSSAPEHSSDLPSTSMQGVQIERPRSSAPGAGLLLNESAELAMWTDRARWFTGVAMGVDFVTAVIALTAGALIHSAALVGYGLEALVDMVASIFVLWRFWNVVDSEASLRANEDRELRANVCIAFIFVIVSLITCADAAEHLATGKHPENSVLIMVFSLITMVLLGAIGCVKWWLNSHIHSKALEQDAMASFATSAISVGIFVSALAFTLHEAIWWFDAVVAICVTVALAAYSIPVLIKNRWWHKSFWKTWSNEPGA